MKKLSIARRLIVSVVLTQLVLTTAVIALATYLTEWQLRNAFDSALHGRAMSVAALVRFSEDEHPHLVFEGSQAPPPLHHERQDMFQITGMDGVVIGQSTNWSGKLGAARRPDRSYWTAHIARERYRVVRLKDILVLDSEGPGVTKRPTITVVYAASTEEIQEQIWTVAVLTSIGSLAILGIATLAAAWAIRKGLMPLAFLANSAGEVTAKDWKLRAPDEACNTVELVPLVAAMDRMLETLERAFTSQRDFVTNAAHELKTPIAVVKSTLQSALQRPRTADEYKGELESALEDVARLETLTHSMLRLARAEQLRAKQQLDMPPVDLAGSCEVTVERWRAIADAKSVRIEMQSSGTPQVAADPDDLETIWNNLLDNAIRYSPAGAEVRLLISKFNGTARVEVQDEGPGIRDEDLPKVFDRFQRSDPSRSRETGGYGLGLAIAKAMVEAYGGTISAQGRNGNGTSFSVQLPLVS